MSVLERAPGGPEIEVTAKATRRRFTVEYKRKIVREADACKTPGAVGALLRRGGVDSPPPDTGGGGGGGGGRAGGGGAPGAGGGGCGPARDKAAARSAGGTPRRAR